MRGLEGKGNWPIHPEQDAQQLRSMTIRLSRDFRDVRWILTKPYDTKYQRPIESRLASSPGRIIAVGLIEERSGQSDKPKFMRFYEEWHSNRGIAIELGYEVKEFRDYLKRDPADRECQ